MTVIAERVHELTGARQPFVHATVVRAQAPTSAVPGDDAVILADGSIEGFVGGVCAETSVRAAALDTLRDGNTMLLRVLPDSSAEFPAVPGAQVVVNPCLSGGAIEIFLRPVLPRQLIGVAGETTPIGAAVVTLAGFLDLETTKPLAYAGASAVVVAGLGRDDEKAIRLALDAGVPLISLVASRTRSVAVMDAMGLTDDERARIRPHAGIDIGARTHKEIALSVLAEIVRDLRTTAAASPSAPTSAASSASLSAPPSAASSASFSAPPSAASSASFSAPPSAASSASFSAPASAASPPTAAAASARRPLFAVTDISEISRNDGGVSVARTAVDPVCGMTVVIGADTPRATVDGVEHWFCCAGCRDSFVAAS